MYLSSFLGGLSCEREGGKAAVAVGANVRIAANEADEGYFVLIHDVVSVC